MSGLLRVTVASATRRLDLAVPATVPVAELIPELALAIGLDRPELGIGMATAGGLPLDAAAGLVHQGVADGALLVLTTGLVPEPRAYDDLADALADAVQRGGPPWPVEAGRHVALLVSGLLLAIGAVALTVLPRGAGAGEAALLVALALVGIGAVLSRRPDEGIPAVACAHLATAYAGAAGLHLAPPGPMAGLPLAVAGGSAAATGLLCVVALAGGRPMLLPPVVLGLVAAGTGAIAHARGGGAAAGVPMLALVLVVLVGVFAPQLAVSRLRAEGADPIDHAVVAADARTAHGVLVAAQSAVAAVLVLVTPIAVARGTPGALLAADATAAVVLGVRHHRAADLRLIGVTSGVVAATGAAAVAVVLHPAWRAVVGALAVASGLVFLAAAYLPATPRRARAADLAEGLVVLALLPLGVLATGGLERLVAAAGALW